MINVKPSSLVHRGSVPAGGFFFARTITGKDEAIRRILSIWKPNSRVYRLKKGILLVLPRPVLASVGEALGLPLVRNQGFFTGMPLTEKEMSAIGQSVETLIISEGGTVSTEQLSDESRELVHKWIDTDGLKFVLGRSLGDEPPAPIVAKPAELPNIRETLGRIPPPPLELKNLLARLRGDPESNKREKFDWLPPYFISEHNGRCPGVHKSARRPLASRRLSVPKPHWVAAECVRHESALKVLIVADLGDQQDGHADSTLACSRLEAGTLLESRYANV